MSTLPPDPSLDFDKKQAKALLAAWRTGDQSTLDRVRAHAPHLVARTEQPVLADAQFIVARERGFDSWPALKAHIEALSPIDRYVDKFLAAIKRRALTTARRLLTERPTLTAISVHVAAAAGDAASVERLLDEQPARLTDLRGEEPWPPLVYACWSPFHTTGPRAAQASRRVVELLLDRGADPNTFTLFESADPPAKLSALYHACESDNAGVAKLLLDRGADPNDGESVPHSAQRNHRRCLALLHAHGADISNAHPHWRVTPMYFVAGQTDDEGGAAAWMQGIEWLLQHGADPNVVSEDARETPLHKLVSSSRTVAAATLLVQHGADVNAARADGRTPYALAVRAGAEEAQTLLRAHGADPARVTLVDTVIGACIRGDEAAARAVTAAAPNWRDLLTPDDRGSLVQAVWTDRASALRTLVAIGFDLAWECEWGGSALHQAAWLGKVDLVRLLVALKAPVDLRDSRFGSSPLAWACHGSSNCRRADADYCAVADMLIDAGAAWDAAVNRWNEAPTDMASRRVARHLAARGLPGV